MSELFVADWRVIAVALLLALAVLVAGYNAISSIAHHKGHSCVYKTLEQHDPLLNALVLLALHRRRVIQLDDVDETVAWMMHRHKHYAHHSVLDDAALLSYVEGCYERLGRRVANRITEHRYGEWL